jgi:uncharacterized membrane protein YeiH
VGVRNGREAVLNLETGLEVLQPATLVLDAIGVAAFAATGALAAARKGMDITGFALLAIVTGVGGGTLRDLLLGITPVGWVGDPFAVFLCIGVAAMTYGFYGRLEKMQKAIVWCDALGLALFSVTGAKLALAAGAAPVVACAMGVVTATFGGIIRDVLSAEVPLILRREIYATASLLGAAVFVILQALAAPVELAMAGGFMAAFTLRGLAIANGWSLPGRDYQH